MFPRRPEIASDHPGYGIRFIVASAYHSNPNLVLDSKFGVD
jgi:hypothetical protein